MATLDEFKNLIKRAEKDEKKGVLTKVEITKYYANEGETIKYNSLEEAFAAKANLADFEEKVIETSFKKDFYLVVTREELNIYKQLIEIDAKLQGLAPVAESGEKTLKQSSIAQKIFNLTTDFINKSNHKDLIAKQIVEKDAMKLNKRTSKNIDLMKAYIAATTDEERLKIYNDVVKLREENIKKAKQRKK